MKKWMTAILVVGFVVAFSTLLASSVNAKNTTKGKPINTPNLMTTVIVDYARGGQPGPPDGGGGGGGGRGRGGGGGEDDPTPDPDHLLGHYEVFGSWADIDPLIEFVIDLTGFPDGSHDAIVAALLTWDLEVPTASLFSDPIFSEELIDVQFGDGISTYSMRNLGGGVLAATFITWDDSITPNGEPDFDELIEMDIVHNSIVKWRTHLIEPKGKWFDVQGVAAHEVGHALGMDHTGDFHPEDFFQTMFASVSSGDPSLDLQSLEAGDVSGILFLYGL